MNNILERFIKYVKIDTKSVEGSDTIPSSPGQKHLAEFLKDELLELGLLDAHVDKNSFVFATIPASKGYETSPVLGLLAHLDTAPDCNGKDVKPIIHKSYDGRVLVLNNNISLDPLEYPELMNYIGDDIVTSDGTTLLGADDKSGIAIIMNVAQKLMTNTSLKHGKIRICFTPDEEISIGGASIFNVDKFGADLGITVDGDGIGELNYETFNAFSYKVKLQGNNIHPADAKGKMLNACTLAMEFDSLIPEYERAEYSQGYQGFIHLSNLNAQVDRAESDYILRDFEKTGLQLKKTILENAADFLNQTYGANTVVLEGLDEYSNPRDLILQQGSAIELCKQAYKDCGLDLSLVPIRGGTDGSTLAQKGLACINIFLGGHNYHSLREFVSVNAMNKSSDVLLRIIELFA